MENCTVNQGVLAGGRGMAGGGSVGASPEAEPLRAAAKAGAPVPSAQAEWLGVPELRHDEAQGAARVRLPEAEAEAARVRRRGLRLEKEEAAARVRRRGEL